MMPARWKTVLLAGLAVTAMLALSTCAHAAEANPRLTAIYMTQDGYLLAMAVTMGSVSAYIDYAGVLQDVRIVTLGDEDYSYGIGESRVEHVGGVQVECYDNPTGLRRVGPEQFEYRTSEHVQLSRIGDLEIGYSYVTAELELPVSVDGYSIEYRASDGKLERFGGARFEYGDFSRGLERIQGTVSWNSDVEIHVIAEICH